jgi:hypothetical protein
MKNLSRKTVGLIICLLLLASSVFAKGEIFLPLGDDAQYPLMVNGTRVEGSKSRNPRPKSSKYFSVDSAGFMVVPQGVGYYVKATVVEAMDVEVNVKIEYQNPADKKEPIVNYTKVMLNSGYLIFSSPKNIRGIVGNKLYSVKISIYEGGVDGEPVDVLKQKVKALVDTQWDDTLVLDAIVLK